MPLLPFADTYLLSNISDGDSEEEEDQYDFDIEYLDLDPTFTSSQQPKWSQQLIKEPGDVVGDPNDKRRTRS